MIREMKQTKTLLTIIFWSNFIVAALIAAVFETGILEPGLIAGMKNNGEFLVTVTFEILTLALVPLALKMFKFRRVHEALISRGAKALQRWGTLRLCILFGLLLSNTLLYYIYMSTAFGYMAIIVVLCLPFVYPTMERCLAETTEDTNEPLCEALEQGTEINRTEETE